MQSSPNLKRNSRKIAASRVLHFLVIPESVVLGNLFLVSLPRYFLELMRRQN